MSIFFPARPVQIKNKSDFEGGSGFNCLWFPVGRAESMLYFISIVTTLDYLKKILDVT